MARFRYDAVSSDGRQVVGETVANDAATVAARFGQRGLLLVSLVKIKSTESGYLSIPPRPRAVTALLAELALMLRSGLPIDEALDLSAQGQPSALSRIVADVRDKVLGGSSFVQALAAHPGIFSRDIVAMAKIAEATGDLAGIFEAVAAERERHHRLTEKMTGALRYPAFLLFSASGVLVFFLTTVIPQFAGIFADSGSDPGTLVRIVLAFSNGLIQHETTFAVGLAVLLAAAFVCWRVIAIRNTIVRGISALPLISRIWLLWRASRFLSTLSLLLRQGVPLTEALKVIEDAIGSANRPAIVSVADGIRRGARLHEALGAVRLLPAVAVRMIRIGEETGELARIAGEAGGLYSRQLEKRLETISGLIGPIAIVLIAGLIGGLMVTIMSALVSVNQSVL
jgi:general secretion pathway protein F